MGQDYVIMQAVCVADHSGVFASCIDICHEQTQLLHAGYLCLWATRCHQGYWHEQPELGLRRAQPPSQTQMANP